MGKRTPATLVDHVVPHKGDSVSFWRPLLWQSSCTWHHAIKFRLERKFERGEVIEADLWLDSPVAVAEAKAHPERQTISADGWPIR